MLDGVELIIVGIVALVVIMWGPSKIPELAKALGRAKGEFDKAQKEFNQVASEISTPAIVSRPAYPSAAYTPPVSSPTNPVANDDLLVASARMLGIATEGKTRSQISVEVSDKVKTMSAAS